MKRSLSSSAGRGPRNVASAPLLAALGVALSLGGCGDRSPHPVCIAGCDEDNHSLAAGGNGGAAGASAAGSDSGSSAGSGPILDLGDGATGAHGACSPEAEERCDGIDNDCDGEVDEGIDFTSPRHCGDCATDCTTLIANVVSPTCNAPDEADGSTPGICEFEACAQDYYDIDPDRPGCEYYCDENPNGENTLDLGGDAGCGRDDDCDGEVDEDVDTCGDPENCGGCGRRCVALHGSATCESNAEDGEECSEANTSCVIHECDSGYFDANRSSDDGCEYRCDPTGNEICDGVDNDCDGLIDNADPDLEDAADIGVACQGGTEGVCASESSTGVSKCIGALVTCCDTGSDDVEGTNPRLPATGGRNGVCDSEEGLQVVHPATVLETCNGLDDDCDGEVDESVTDAIGPCGTDVGACISGTLTCDSEGGGPICQGAKGPSSETCNGIDDDCDGVVDGVVSDSVVSCSADADCASGQQCVLQTHTSLHVCASPTPDVGVPCEGPPEVEGGVSGCRAGATACSVTGQIVCEGAVTRPLNAVDTCGVDANCDGILTDVPLNLITSCGSCSNDCTAVSPNTDWSCVETGTGYQCQSNGCLANWHDLIADDDDPCDSYCVSLGQEICNGVDDDCDGAVDELDDMQVPSDTGTIQAICRVPSAFNPGCLPSVACSDGSWACRFSDPDICGGSAADCSVALDADCDGKDNDCDGVIDDAFAPQKGTTCSRTGQGNTCATEGRWACSVDGTTIECNAPEPLPSEEVCDGVDNDCDGHVDETFRDTGSGADDGEFVRPAVVALGPSGPWMFAYEASRPDATEVSQGTGNGYVWTAPSGESLDATLPCSVPSRLPWTNVAGTEVEQACLAMGGRICRRTEWTGFCQGASGSCTFGFQGCEAVSDYTNGPFCNLAAFDVASATAGDQDSLTPTAHSELSGCASSWSGTNGNTLDAYDTAGNAREFARCQSDRAICSDEASCAADCCAGTSVATVDGLRLCGAIPSTSQPDRRLSGQPCTDSVQCCDDDDACDATSSSYYYGVCLDGLCVNDTVTATACVASGVACTDANGDQLCDEYGTGGVACCDGAPPADGHCGASSALPYATYPLMGGSYRTVSEGAAQCDYDFFTVGQDFRLFDTGFRCCFDQDPREEL